MLRFDRRASASIEPIGEVSLPFERRQRSRLRVVLESGAHAGEAVGIVLERGSVLRDGDILADAVGRTIRVRSATEALLHLTAADAPALARLAYHLGNRHVAVQVGESWLRIADDHVLGRMAEGLGARVARLEAPFEPESGAYGHGADHGHAHHGHAHPGHGHDHTHAHDDDPAAARSDGATAMARRDDRHAPRIHDLAELREASR